MQTYLLLNVSYQTPFLREWRVGKRNARNYARTLKAIAMEQKRTRKKECLAEGKHMGMGNAHWGVKGQQRSENKTAPYIVHGKE